MFMYALKQNNQMHLREALKPNSQRAQVHDIYLITYIPSFHCGISHKRLISDGNAIEEKCLRIV